MARFSVLAMMVIGWICFAETAVPNLTEACFKCMCQASTRCISFNKCPGGFCGPFNLSRTYWIDAGQPTLPNVDPESKNAFEDCAKNYECAKTIIEAYLEKFSMDCNNDGVIDCLDHLMVNANGGYDCSAPLNSTATGNRWLASFEKLSIYIFTPIPLRVDRTERHNSQDAVLAHFTCLTKIHQSLRAKVFTLYPWLGKRGLDRSTVAPLRGCCRTP